ncbi:type II toxin-antitoxin system ParD family antitoxin [Brumimicrobium glaciale]|uniref:Type II toxin-antitoxin system ParD family antitoxin n=1 Tax=Brumimicrobium glaciale TaxID=200475 RepID=A0A4Q4KM98_9FLAO|nr:type II toxin-antitoxin system ParD family antitoxin [Brumimicrobium glaciale]RYM33009.1 type II toxin-antitoxin system ParD family antitoxin [Brumimicrobium glaciale]
MAKNTSFTIGNHFNEFISNQVKSGRFSSTSEVIKAALKLLEYEETHKEKLLSALEQGEKSGFIEDFDRTTYMKKLHEKYDK